MKNLLMTATLILALSAILALPAYAYRGDMTAATIRQDRPSAPVKVEGSLTCTMGDANLGRPCALQIHDIKSGKSFFLSNAEDAMKLYAEGSKSVTIEGSFAGADTIEVAKASAL